MKKDPISITDLTLDTYTSKIMLMNIFNVDTCVGHKIESQYSAEWSIRNSVSYSLGIA